MYPAIQVFHDIYKILLGVNLVPLMVFLLFRQMLESLKKSHFYTWVTVREIRCFDIGEMLFLPIKVKETSNFRTAF